MQHYNLLYSCVYEKERGIEQFVEEHALGIILSGELHLFTNKGTIIFKKNSIGLIRRNQLAKSMKFPESNGKPFKAINILLDQNALKKYASIYTIKKQDRYKGDYIIDLTKNSFLKDYLESLLPYFDNPELLTGEISENKTIEAVKLLLKAKPELFSFLFDFNDPHKIDLEAFMVQNFTFNVTLNKFAKLTGRSLATFKRDFRKTFNDSPSQWLTKKRLEEAHYLIAKKNKRPTDIYLDLGFENLSHFSYAFKKQFGVSPMNL
ncbi:AraC family transcriptional regulator [Mariniflexile litorale]|uniref:AraC family transcriptional regulator n=1 Tax=Mariniflexile litorale TaxID=3045158 RepID=A0AAU7EBL4_9FLAO|nr:AraC family transcriptional regulator [Mariniflexile sp. KMM 9835]MDQ8213042.1 AraC family transcriptional regulator [Mariniflexile sp. KMM 9835]